MNTVTIYRVHREGTYSMYEQGESYSLEPWGDDTSYYEGWDDGGQKYMLPEGCTVGKLISGEKMIFSDGMAVPLIEVNGKPALALTPDGVVLEVAEC